MQYWSQTSSIQKYDCIIIYNLIYLHIKVVDPDLVGYPIFIEVIKMRHMLLDVLYASTRIECINVCSFGSKYKQ